MALRSGVDVRTIIEQLRGIRCHSTLRQGNLKVLSCPDAIGRVLERVAELRGMIDGNGDEKARNGKNGLKCPECGSAHGA